jgi:hypothetical protein
VRILSQDFACFNTKKRVPYKIIIETVALEDLDKIEFLEEFDFEIEQEFDWDSILNNKLK